MKKFLSLHLLPLLLLAPIFLWALSLCRPAAALSESQRGAISQYCASIKQTLRVIQREDSRARISVGAIYETIGSRYLTPLNLRLINNNIASPTLVELQSSFASLRSNFSAEFINYSRSLEDLIASDCQTNPDGFYAKLQQTRARRNLVSQIAAELNSAARSAIPAVQDIRSNLSLSEPLSQPSGDTEK